MTQGVGLNFGEFITEIDNGKLFLQLSEAVEQIAAAVNEHSSSGELKLTLKFTKQGQVCKVEPKWDAKIPHEPVLPTPFYFDPHKGISREDHRQLTLQRLRDRGVEQERGLAGE